MPEDYKQYVNADIVAQTLIELNTKEYWEYFDFIASNATKNTLAFHTLFTYSYAGEFFHGQVELYPSATIHNGTIILLLADSNIVAAESIATMRSHSVFSINSPLSLARYQNDDTYALININLKHHFSTNFILQVFHPDTVATNYYWAFSFGRNS